MTPKIEEYSSRLFEALWLEDEDQDLADVIARKLGVSELRRLLAAIKKSHEIKLRLFCQRALEKPTKRDQLAVVQRAAEEPPEPTPPVPPGPVLA